MSAKRKRSASAVSEQISIAAVVEKTEVMTPVTTEMLPPPTPITNKARSRRGGNRKGGASATQEPSVNGDAEESMCRFLIRIISYSISWCSACTAAREEASQPVHISPKNK